MPFLRQTASVPTAPSGEASYGERFTVALVGLTRTVWHPDCTFESAIASICEVAAKALRIDRVSVWRYDVQAQQLRCLDAYSAASGEHQPSHALDVLPLEGDDYLAALADARTFDATELQGQANSHRALHDYLQRYDIHALLDAPAYVGGELQGVICHESVHRSRIWSREETTFAASMGDYVAMAFEIARRRRAEAEVEHLRLHDAATGLPNRDYMVELVRQRLSSPTLGENTLSVVHVQVNPTGGVVWSGAFPSEEQVMVRMGERLRTLTGSGIELARTRGHGFSFLVGARAGERSIIRLAESILGLLGGMDWTDTDADPSVSVGIALADRSGVTEARELLHHAQEAAEQAAATERFSYAIFDHEHHAALLDGLRQERAMREAFANGKFELHYQPEYDASTGRWVAAESLLRWRQPDRLVVAGEFISVLEASGLMLPVGRWVLEQACRDAVRWPLGTDGRPMAVRVNVSARQFDEAGLVDDVNAALQASGLDPARLCLELTESTLMRDIDRALEILRYLRELGVQLAIDDFGTGYASLVYLKRLPIDVLKVDRSFVQGFPDDAADAAIVQAIVALANAFGIDVVAEGVELRTQQDALMSIGVHRMQGWLFGKAMDNAALCRLIESGA